VLRFAVRCVITIVGLLAAREFVNWAWDGDRIVIEGAEPLLVGAAIFVVVRAVLRPVLIFLTCPLQVITLGLFIFVVNALILLLTEEVCSWIGVDFGVKGFWVAFVGGLVISAVSFTLSRFLRRNPLGPWLK
jgi:putative membrane protein